MALYAFDGTWNSATLSDDVVAEDETNVAAFYDAYDGKKWYVAGPGTRHSKIGKVIGGFTGAGGHSRVKEAYEALCTTWEAGDTIIDVIGFSRGAALALDFGNKVLDDGIRRPGTKQVIHENPHIRFLGLWDVVGSFGIPIDVGTLSFQETNFGHRLSLPDSVEYCFHAMAMDERRQTFRVTRLLNGYEVWFRGVHSDVGGGNGNVGLSYIALRWMLRKARAAGLPIKDAVITSRDPKIDPAAALRLAKDLIPNEHRGFLKGDRLHYTVTNRPGHNNPAADLLRETEQAEAEALRTSSLSRGEPTPL